MGIKIKTTQRVLEDLSYTLKSFKHLPKVLGENKTEHAVQSYVARQGDSCQYPKNA